MFYVLRGEVLRIHHRLTSLIVILQKLSQSLKENNSEGFCVIAHSPNTAQPEIEFDVQDESKLLHFNAFSQRKQASGSLRLVQSNCPQLFPAPPFFLLALFETVFFSGSERKCSCVESFRLNEKNQPIWLTFLAKAVIFCCHSLTSSPEQFLGSGHLYPPGQWRLSYSLIPQRRPIAGLPNVKCGCTTKHNHFNKSISQFLSLKNRQTHLFSTQRYLFQEL